MILGETSEAPWLAGLPAGRAVARLAAELRAAGIEAPEADARILVREAMGVTGAELIKEPGRVVSEAALARLEDFRRRRLAREPVSRILGRREFYGRPFLIGAATLDPRPETETIVDAALALVAAEGSSAKPLRILDVGTGSGCLILTLLAELPQATGFGTDVSDAALEVARTNARTLGLESRVRFLERRSLEAIEGPFDLLVSNPPYIPTADIAGLADEVRGYDPHAALDGGDDGLEVYRELADGIRRVVPAGWSLFEVGVGQAERVAGILSRGVGGRDDEIRVFQDLGGVARCVALGTQSRGDSA